MSVILSFGKFGGFYIYHGFSFRVCLGWIALTIIPVDVDELFRPTHVGADAEQQQATGDDEQERVAAPAE